MWPGYLKRSSRKQFQDILPEHEVHKWITELINCSSCFVVNKVWIDFLYYRFYSLAVGREQVQIIGVDCRLNQSNFYIIHSTKSERQDEYAKILRSDTLPPDVSGRARRRPSGRKLFWRPSRVGFRGKKVIPAVCEYLSTTINADIGWKMVLGNHFWSSAWGRFKSLSRMVCRPERQIHPNLKVFPGPSHSWPTSVFPHPHSHIRDIWEADHSQTGSTLQNNYSRLCTGIRR